MPNGYKSEAIFYVPGFLHKCNAIQELLWIKDNKSYMFKDNAKIGALYDSMNNIWAGGRYFYPQRIEKPVLYNLRESFNNKYNVPLRFVFTNSELKEEHLNDTYSNQITDMFANGKNEILVNSSILEKYLRNKYGDVYKYCSSITKGFRKGFDNVREDLEKYYTVVTSYNDNKNFEYLESLPHHERIEILVNSTCAEHCPHSAEHYRVLSFINIDCDISHEDPFTEWCPLRNPNGHGPIMTRKNRKHYIGPEDIDTYLDMGINKFKIEGRDMTYAILIPSLLDYLIKDEYREEAYTIMLTGYEGAGDSIGDMLPIRDSFYTNGYLPQ